MFRKWLERMFSRVYAGEAIDYLDGVLTFKALTRIPVGRRSMKLVCPGIVLPVVIHLKQEVSPGQICSIPVKGPWNSKRMLSQLYPCNLPETWIRKVLRVVSPVLPGYQASTMGIGPEGCLVKVSGGMEVGAKIELAVELDDGSWEPLRFTGIVSSVRQLSEGECLVRIDFVRIAGDPVFMEATKAWERYIRSRKELEQGFDVAGTYKMAV